MLLLLVTCVSLDDEPDYAPGALTSQPQDSLVQDDVEPGEFDPVRADAMAASLFGEEFDYVRVMQADSALALELVNRTPSVSDSNELPQSYLRTRILQARATASREQALAIADLHLAWLMTAQEEGAAACRQVTGESFGNGTPQMRDDWIAYEKNLAGQLLVAGAFNAPPPVGAELPAVPSWAVEAAAERYDIDDVTLQSAMAGIGDPNRCAIEIALLQALLERPEDVTPSMLAAI